MIRDEGVEETVAVVVKLKSGETSAKQKQKSGRNSKNFSSFSLKQKSGRQKNS